jgi:metal-responsive CopG/Arc/MetJ family transcriptional regulator
VAVGVRLRKDLLGEVNRLAKSSKQSRNRTMAHLIEVGLSKAA